MFSKGFFFKVVKSRDYVVKGQEWLVDTDVGDELGSAFGT